MTPERLKLEIISIFQELHERGPLTMPCAAVASAKLDELVRPLCQQAAGAMELATAAENFVEAVNEWDRVIDGDVVIPAHDLGALQDRAAESRTEAMRTLGRAIYQVKEKQPNYPKQSEVAN